MMPLAPLLVGLRRCCCGLGRWMPLAFEARSAEVAARLLVGLLRCQTRHGWVVLPRAAAVDGPAQVVPLARSLLLSFLLAFLLSCLGPNRLIRAQP